MNLQVLVSTMNQTDHNLINRMNISSDAVVINQCHHNQSNSFKNGKNNIKWIDVNDSGLCNSRNLAIENATGDICVIADDDMVYVDNYKDIILKQFENYPNADIIIFQVEGIEKNFKNYHNKPRKLNYFTLMKVSSVEISFRLSSIRNNNIKFNEIFGAGSVYFAGEENIFLTDCAKKGLIIQYVPIKIADLHLGDSSWFKGYNEEYFIAKGAVFAALSKRLSVFYILQFAIRKYKLYSKETSMKDAAINMFKGKKEFLSSLK